MTKDIMMTKAASISRLGLLGLVTSGVFAVLLHSIIGNPEAKPLSTPFEFPDEVALSKWELTDSEPKEGADIRAGKIPVAHTYQYEQENLATLDIEMYYITNMRDINGDVQLLTRQLGELPFPIEQQTLSTERVKDVGYYAVTDVDDTHYLGSCINPRGGSTVTKEQFLKNRTVFDLAPGRMFSWLRGQVPLRDKRCLFVLMSMTSEGTDSTQTADELVAAWSSWGAWWQGNFPAP